MTTTSHEAAHRPATSAMEPTPDPLAKAFNDAIRPFQLKIEEYERDLDDKDYKIEQLENERADMHAWIDKRGLRAGSSHPIGFLESQY